MNNYWISWYSTKEQRPFELHSPWWISGSRCSDNAETIVAALRADTEEDAKEIIPQCHDNPPPEESIEFRFCEEQPADWNPLKNESGRFPPKKWMKW